MVVEIGDNRDYIVKTPAGRLYHRKRRLLRQRVVVLPGDIRTASPVLPTFPLPPAPQDQDLRHSSRDRSTSSRYTDPSCPITPLP